MSLSLLLLSMLLPITGNKTTIHLICLQLSHTIPPELERDGTASALGARVLADNGVVDSTIMSYSMSTRFNSGYAREPWF
ncbi:hypothetical protein C8R42DRAFT_657998 [Lentinula raphanica]|nr:hypothetical protein C8R42DRAFT_657998 [Lentinula raphanica]